MPKQDVKTMPWFELMAVLVPVLPAIGTVTGLVKGSVLAGLHEFVEAAHVILHSCAAGRMTGWQALDNVLVV